MLFVEQRFLLFFLLVFVVHWALRRSTARKTWLLVASYTFYAAWDWRFLGLIVASTLVDYVVGLRLSRPATRHRRSWLLVSLVVNLGLLGVFKYLDFFIESAVELSAWLGLPIHARTFGLILPVGISFYTFQTLSYSIDVYRGTLRPTRNLLDLALFVGFFPQLVAGPIVRAAEFLPQLREPRRFGAIPAKPMLVLFLLGFVKKACVADHLAIVVDRYWEAPATFDALSAWLAALAYSGQIYCDFSGYSDMAIACAGLLGYRLPLNFRHPYFAVNASDYWRRWHISLSSWLRDYLYIPLGGNRGSRLFTARNLMLTMLLGGLWHGASWNFVIWGALHGVALIVFREWHRHVGGKLPVTPGQIPSRVLMFVWATLCYIFFRAPDLASSTLAARAFVTLQSPGAESVSRPEWWWLLGVFAVLHAITARVKLPEASRRIPDFAFAILFGVAFALAQSLVAVNYQPFVYFQF